MQLKQLLPLTLSFMTYAKELGQQTDWARRAGHELFLHVPMISKLTSVPSLIAAGPAASSCAMPSATCWDREFADSPLEGGGFELVWGFSCQVVVFGLLQFFVRSGKAVLRSLIAPQVSRRLSTSA